MFCDDAALPDRLLLEFLDCLTRRKSCPGTVVNLEESFQTKFRTKTMTTTTTTTSKHNPMAAAQEAATSSSSSQDRASSSGLNTPEHDQTHHHQHHHHHSTNKHHSLLLMSPALTVDPYQVLQVRRDATHSEIRQAYRRLALWHHPGRSLSVLLLAYDDPAERRLRRLAVFGTVAACFETLMDAPTRRRCDGLLRDLELVQKHRHWLPGDVHVGGRKVVGLQQQDSSKPSCGSSQEEEGDQCVPFLSPASSSSSASSASSNSVVINANTANTMDDYDDDEGGNSSRSACPLLPVEDSTSTIRKKCSLIRGRTTTTPNLSCSSTRRQNRKKPRHLTKQQQQSRREQHEQPPEVSEPPLRILECCRVPSTSEEEYDERRRNHRFRFPSSLETHVSSQDEDFVAMQSLLNSSSTSEGADPDIHYTSAETNRLFGGPLQLLFRARRWKPFTDPFTVFATVFGSHLPLGNVARSSWKRQAKQLRGQQQQQCRLAHPVPHHATGVSGEAQPLPDGGMVVRRVRTLPDRRIVRTEIVRVDELTGNKVSTVTVTTEELPGMDDHSPRKERVIDFCFSLDNTCCPLPPSDKNGAKAPHSPSVRAVNTAASSTNGGSKKIGEEKGVGDVENSKGDNDVADDDTASMWSFTSACQSWLPICV